MLLYGFGMRKETAGTFKVSMNEAMGWEPPVARTFIKFPTALSVALDHQRPISESIGVLKGRDPSFCFSVANVLN